MTRYKIKLEQHTPGRVVIDVTLTVVSDTALDEYEDECIIVDEFYPEINTIAKAFFNPGYYEVEVFDEDGRSVEFETKVN